MLIADRYELIGDIPPGGMSYVAECRDRHLDRRVVLKVLRKGVEDRRLLDEQKALLSLRSKHVVQILDIVPILLDGTRRSGLILEYIDGTDLQIGSIQSVDTLLRVMWQIACGLADIHAKGVIHRDIKPNNIRIDGEGVVKILDFGLARDAGAAATVGAIGTMGFMAPELWSASHVSFDRSIDVYAFCVTAIALASGSLPAPLARIPPVALLEDDVRNALPSVAPSVLELVTRGLSPNPSSRPSAAELRDTIAREILKGQHRGLVVLNGKPHELNNGSRIINIGSNVGQISIKYDEYRFIVDSVTGTVTINNRGIKPGDEVPGCCVITFGDGGRRSFVTFDISNPEVAS